MSYREDPDVGPDFGLILLLIRDLFLKDRRTNFLI